MFRPLSRSFILALGYIVRFGNSLADYITKLLVGQGCLLRCVFHYFNDFPAFQ